MNGGADDERSEADGVSVAMSPEATSRGVVGTLAPEPEGVKRGVPRVLTEPTAEVRSRLSAARA